MENNRIAIFIDAENVTNWLKKRGAELLLEELSTIGQTVVRRAYGIWTNLKKGGGENWVVFLRL